MKKIHLVDQKDEYDKPHCFCGSESLNAVWSMLEFLESKSRCEECLKEYYASRTIEPSSRKDGSTAINVS